MGSYCDVTIPTTLTGSSPWQKPQRLRARSRLVGCVWAAAFYDPAGAGTYQASRLLDSTSAATFSTG